MSQRKRLLNNSLAILLAVFAAILCWVNYAPNTFLTGWDTLHPEFNFPLNFQKIIFGVWREDQGLGAVAGHSHMSEFPRLILMWLSSLVVPVSDLRYLYYFACLILGPLGVYYFLEKIVIKNKVFSFLGGLFYLLNLGTVQHFFIPFEMFATQYAALGWLFLFATKFLERKNKKYLILFSITTFLATPQAYAATLFYSYLIAFGLYLGAYLIKNHSALKQIIIIMLATFAINSFWLLPNLYYLKTSAGLVPEAKTNLLFSENVYQKNAKFGNLEDTALLKGFLFEWMSLDKNNNREVLLNKWVDHLNNPVAILIGYLSFGIILWGILMSLKEKNLHGLLIIPIFLSSYFFITGMNTPLSPLYEAFRNSPLFKEALRMPWTKFSITLMFSYSLFFALGNYYLYEIFKKRKPEIISFQGVLISGLLIIFMLPAFSSNLIGEIMRVKIPREYFEGFNWINKQNITGKIANFPTSSYSGWEVTNWGYQGSGFFWFGENMAYLSRDFDRWTPYNENYYHEISYAIYSNNFKLFENLLDKYQASFVYLDENIVSQATKKDFNYTEWLKNNLENSKKFKKAAIFGKLTFYKVLSETEIKNNIFIAESLPTIGPKYSWNNFDSAFQKLGDYEISNEPKYYYPFRSLFTGRKQSELEFTIEDNNDYFLFKTNIPDELNNYHLQNTEFNIEDVTEIDKTDLTKLNQKLPSVIPTENGNFTVKIPKIKGVNSSKVTVDKYLNEYKPYNCGDFSTNQNKSKKTENSLKMNSIDSGYCLDIPLENISQKFGYIITIESKNIQGNSLLFSVINKNSKKADLETYLPKYQMLNTSYFIIPPMESDGLGYSLFFKNISQNSTETINELGKITVNQIPYNFLTNLVFVKDEGEIQPETYAVNSSHPNPSLYEININDLKVGESTIVLSQSFHNGWNAYKVNKNIPSLFAPIFGEKNKDHVLINNWENGWKVEKGLLEKDSKIIITFLPQYLEYFGFLLLLLPFVIRVLR